jgi:hypothetical protein
VAPALGKVAVPRIKGVDSPRYAEENELDRLNLLILDTNQPSHLYQALQVNSVRSSCDKAWYDRGKAFIHL